MYDSAMNRQLVGLCRVWMVALLTACTGLAPTPSPEPTLEEKVIVRWLVDTGGAWRPKQAWVDGFNASQDRIQLVLQSEHVDLDWLVSRLAFHAEDETVEVPDILGPYSPSMLQIIPATWLDLTPYLPAGSLADFTPAGLRAWQDENARLRGLPLILHPAVIFFNRDLFDAAGLPYPPLRNGEPYADGEAWDIGKLEEIALQLTLDSAGRHPTDPGFDPQAVVQYGFHPQWLYPRQMAAAFGSDPLLGADEESILPASWEEAFRWVYAGIWEKGFIPSGQEVAQISEYNNAFDSGKVAMVYSGTYLLCCLPSVEDWGLAVLPAHQGTVSGSIESLGFAVLDISEHPAEAAQAVAYLASLPDLIESVDENGIPARASLQASRLAGLDERTLQEVDWQVVLESLAVTIKVGFDSRGLTSRWLEPRLYEFWEELNSQQGMDLEAALDRLRADIQEHVDQAGP